MELLNDVNNNVVAATDSTAKKTSEKQEIKEEKINSTFTPDAGQSKTNNESVSVFNAKKDNAEVNVQVESTKTQKKEHDKGKTKNDYVRPVSQYEIESSLRDPCNPDSNIYQEKLEEINKLNAKPNPTITDEIKLQSLTNDIKIIKQRTRYRIMTTQKENHDIYESNGAKKIFTVELINVTDTQKNEVNKNTNNTGNTDTKETSGNTGNTGNTENNTNTKPSNNTDNTIGVKIAGMYSKNGSTIAGDITLGNDYILNGSFEQIANKSTFGIDGSAKITGNSEIEASAHAYYIYTKGTTEFSARGNYSVYSANIDNTRQNFQDGDVSLNVDTPHFGTDVTAEFTEIGNCYSANARGSYAREWKNGITFDIITNGGYSYYDTYNAHTATFGLNAKVSYNEDNIKGYAAVDARGNYTKSNTHNVEYISLSTAFNLGVSAKNFDFNTNIIYEKESDGSGLQCGAGLGYTIQKLGNTKVEVDYNQTINLTDKNKEKNTTYPKHKIDVKIKVPFGQIIDKYFTNTKGKELQKAESIGL